MGYYTAYTVTVLNGNDKSRVDDEETLVKMGTALVEISDWFAEDEKGWSIEDVVGSEMMKWYDYEHEMIELSNQFPDYIFVLEGEGEDSLDVWRRIFHNGNEAYYEAKVVYDFGWVMGDLNDSSIRGYENYDR